MSRAASLQSPMDTTPGRKRPASQQVVSSRSAPHREDSESSGSQHFADVYAHPAAVAYAAAHPRRTIPKFGPYLLLQTLGEGEFGKVKLGLHAQWGEEVAVKLIRRGSIDSDARMGKVEREIEVLRTLKHPHIVRLYDVIETDKYIGIILEYASGGELFDHILASRYLRERDAAKLFAQLLSGVWYIHQKQIVHRDLKLENLLLDKGRNVIITDFGFANRFGSAPRRGEDNPAQAYGDVDAFTVAPDLMQTSCGSPCYAAPELVVSEGLYVGSAVDVWSCGVILYAMLAGYLPFDDDPANPDGDNINLLYKYIVSTPLAYPDYVSDAARGILSLMLQPDPRRRASLEQVMRHPWLDAHWEEGGKRDKGAPPLSDSVKPMGTAFGRTVEDLEKEAMSQHQAKRMAYQRQMRALAEQRARSNGTESSTRGSTRPASTMPGSSSKSSRGPRDKDGSSRTPSSVTRSQTEKPKHREPEFLYETSGAPATDDDPFAPAGGAVFNAFKSADGVDPREVPGGYVRDPAYDAEAAEASVSRNPSKRHTDREAERDAERRAAEKEAERKALERKESERRAAEKKAAEKKSGFRHTVQVEYDGDRSERRADRDKERADRERERADRDRERERADRELARQDRERAQRELERAEMDMDREEKVEGKQRARGPSTSPVATLRGEAKDLPPSPSNIAPSAWHDIQVPMTPVKFATPRGDADSTDSHEIPRAPGMARTPSVPQSPDEIIMSARRAVEKATEIRRRESQTKGHGMPERSASQTGHKRGMSVTRLFSQNGEREPEQAQQENLVPPPAKEAKKERRSTLTVMVGRTMKGRREPSSAVETTERERQRERERERHAMEVPVPSVASSRTPPGSSTEIGERSEAGGQLDGASTSKARRVMDWFRTKSKARESTQFPGGRDDSHYPPSRETTEDGMDSGVWNGPAVRVHPPAGEVEEEEEQEPPTPRMATSTNTSVASAPPPISSAPSSTSHGTPVAPARTPSSATDSSFMARIAGVRSSFGRTPSSKETHKERGSRKEGFRESLTVGGKKKDRMTSKERTPRTRSSASYALRALRPHAGALDTRMLTTENPSIVIARAKEVLAVMGLEIQVEHECKLRCVRPKQVGGGAISSGTDGASTSGSTLAAVAMMGTAGSNGVDRRGLPMPGAERRGLPLPGASADRSFSGGLRGLGLLMRRQSSQAAALDDDIVDLSVDAESIPVQGASEPLYGPPTHDALDEVRFALEITAFKNLEGQFLVEIRRLKGQLKSYKFLYETVRERLELQQP